MVNMRGTLREFIEDIEPFFYGKRLTYIDIGAFQGTVYQELLDSKLKIREAHLFEPNPKTFKELNNKINDLNIKSTHVHNNAVGNKEEILKFKSNASMTKVVDTKTTETKDIFSIESITVDNFINTLPEQHISLLKVDVEGFEKEVFEGALNTLKNQDIDMIYVEAGMSKDNKQQCYYRDIDDILVANGYRVFRMYEQMFEWIDDSPFLRRVNMAYMSEKFAKNNPFRLANEIFALSKKQDEFKEQLREKTEKVDFFEKETKNLLNKLESTEKTIEELQLNLSESEERYKTSEVEKKSLLQNLESVNEGDSRTVQEWNELLNKLESTEKTIEDLQMDLNKSKERTLHLESKNKQTTHTIQNLTKIAKSLLQNLENVTKENNKLANKLDRVYGYLSYKVGSAIVKNSKSFIDFFKIPYAVYCARKEYSSKKKNVVDNHQSATEEKIQNLKKQLNIIINNEVEPLKLKQDLKENYILPKPVKVAIIKQAHQIMLEGKINEGIFFAEKHAEGEQISSIELLKANKYIHDNDKWLLYLNNYLEKFNVGKVELSSDFNSRFLNLVNAKEYEVVDGPLVSVIMPAYNAENFISLSVHSILNQTWKNLELIIIDDCSTDNTWEILSKIATEDKRIKLLKNEVNVGPYVSKNYALLHAKGEYITGHDADDFAFSKRIENHVAYMLKHPNVKASTNNKLRLRENGEIVNFTAVRSAFDDGSASKAFISCMFERDFLVNRLGFWDSVRFGADGEIINRAKIILKDDFHELHLLSMLCLDDSNSLTNHPDHGISKTTGLSPARKFYLNHYKQWHDQLKPKDCYMKFPLKERPFEIMDASGVPLTAVKKNLG